MSNISNYPNDWPNGMSRGGIVQPPITDGKPVVYVSSVSGLPGGDGTFLRPRDTLANGLVLLPKTGGYIILLPDHSESISSAVTYDNSNVTIIGKSFGNTGAQFVFEDSVNASMLFTGDNISFSGVVKGTSKINAILSPFLFSGNNISGNIYWEDYSSTIEAIRAVVFNGCSSINLNIHYTGFIDGNDCQNAVRLIDCSDSKIMIYAYGNFSTACIEMATTASKNITVYGYVYNNSVSDGSKDIVDTVTGSTWYGELSDGKVGEPFSGGSSKAWGPNSSAEDIEQILSFAQKTVLTSPAAMVNNQTIFTISGGSVAVYGIMSTCVTANDTTASTLQYASVPTVGNTVNLCDVSASLANKTPGSTVTITGDFADAAVVSANGGGAISFGQTPIVVPEGIIKINVGVGSTTGTWKHTLFYTPLGKSVLVS